MTAAPVSTEKTTPCANELTSATKLSPTRTGSVMQFGQVAIAPPLFASAAESSASPVPWPYCTSSNGIVVELEEVPAGDVVDVAVAVVVDAVREEHDQVLRVGRGRCRCWSVTDGSPS